MNLQDFASVAEIVGGFAIIVSIIYLSVQIRNQTQESRFTATREMHLMFGEFLLGLADTREKAAIYLQATKDYEALPDEERVMMSFIFNNGFRVLEQLFMHLSSGNVDTTYFTSISRAFGEWLGLAGVRQWWDLSKHMFADEFQVFIDEIMSSTSEGSYHSTFSKNRGSAT